MTNQNVFRHFEGCYVLQESFMLCRATIAEKEVMEVLVNTVSSSEVNVNRFRRKHS